MNDHRHERYSRHVLLPQIGATGQARLHEARVLVIGLGGLGSPAAMYLATAGVGELVLSDYDFVELSNLQRQIIHGTDDIGRDKVDSARETIGRLNAEVRVTTKAWELEGAELAEEVRRADVVLDACDNFESRFGINAACWAAGTPLVSGAAIRWEGLVSVFDPRRADSPCYRCLYDDASFAGEACSQVGVVASLLGVVGSIQATEAIKLITGAGEPLVGRVVTLDALSMEWRELRLRKLASCPVCGTTANA
jgi:adenylyltransferase/sulfurtransferase